MKRPVRIAIALLAIICLGLWFYLHWGLPEVAAKPAYIAKSSESTLKTSASSPAFAAESTGSKEPAATDSTSPVPQAEPLSMRPPLLPDKVAQATKAYLKYSEMERVARVAIKDFEAKNGEIVAVTGIELSVVRDDRHSVALIEALRDPDSGEIFNDVFRDAATIGDIRNFFQKAAERLGPDVRFPNGASPDQLLGWAMRTEGDFQQHYDELSKKLALGDDLNRSAIKFVDGQLCSYMLKQYMAAHGYRFNDNTKQFVEIQ